MAEIELWLVDLERASTSLEALEADTPRLSEADHQRFAAMQNVDASRERRAAHIALRVLLERKCGPGVRQAPFARNAAGKPSLPSGYGSFSLAHTRGVALAALADDGAIGVDIERARTVRMPARRRGPIEEAAVVWARGAPLNGTTADARFLNAWVRLEARAKALGTGVGPVLEELRPGRMEALSSSLSDRQPGPVTHDLAVGEDLFAAVALAPGRTPPVLKRLPFSADAIVALAHP